MIKKLSILIVLILNSSILLSQVKKDTNYIDSLLGNICVWEKTLKKEQNKLCFMEDIF